MQHSFVLLEKMLAINNKWQFSSQFDTIKVTQLKLHKMYNNVENLKSAYLLYQSTSPRSYEWNYSGTENILKSKKLE